MQEIAKAVPGGRRKVGLSWLQRGSALAFFAIHLGCFAVFLVPFSWWLVTLAAVLYLVRMFAITAGYHRYFAHRTFRTSRAFQFVLAVLGASSLQKGPLWWAAHHRHHHQHSDQPEDLHSPQQDGLYWSHVGWILSADYLTTNLRRIADFANYSELRWLDRWHQVPGLVLAGLLLVTGGWPAFVWGFCVSTVATWHATFSINSLTHLVGRRRYATNDDSRNSMILALLTLGEGWHNNHHHYKSSVRQGFYWWEVDVSYYLLRLLAVFRIVWDLKLPQPAIVARGRLEGSAPATN